MRKLSSVASLSVGLGLRARAPAVAGLTLAWARASSTGSDEASAAALGFIAKLVAKSGFVEVTSASRLLPSRMHAAIKEKYAGDLTALVSEQGAAFGLEVGGDGALIVSKRTEAPKPSATAAAQPQTSAKAAPAQSAASVPPKSVPGLQPPASPGQRVTTPSASKASAGGKPAPPPPPPFAAPKVPGAAAGAPTASPKKRPPAAPKLPNLPGGGRPNPQGAAPPFMMQGGGDAFNMGLRTWRSPAEVVDALMEYIPTFWIRSRHVHNALPHEMKELYGERMRLHQFLRKFQFYFDTKITPEGPFIKARDSCSHPKKGFADDRYASSLLNDPAARPGAADGPLGADARTLEGRMRSVVPTEFTPLSEIDAKLPPDVMQHADFDRNSGCVAVLEKFPQYFQIVDGRARLRPVGVAPNALDERTAETSPNPELFRRLYAMVPEDSSEAVKTATLFASLSASEKADLKKEFRSFPRFLRVHGRVICVSPDNLEVRRFAEELPDDVDAAALGLPADSEIVGKRLPTETSFDASATEVAIKELFDALPLLQCVPLDDLLFMLPAQVRTTLKGVNLQEELLEYPSYFALWQFPDDPSVLVVQRATLETPEVPVDEIIATVQQLVPQGGIDAERLMRRLPLAMQRYFYRHGLRKTLAGLGQHFLVVGDKILSIGE